MAVIFCLATYWLAKQVSNLKNLHRRISLFLVLRRESIFYLGTWALCIGRAYKQRYACLPGVG